MIHPQSRPPRGHFVFCQNAIAPRIAEAIMNRIAAPQNGGDSERPILMNIQVAPQTRHRDKTIKTVFISH